MPRSGPHRSTHAVATWCVGGYLAVVVTFEVLRVNTGWPRPDDVASSPAGVATGNVWALFTSGLAVAGEPIVQLAGTILTAALVVAVLGARVFWLAALIAHLGSALIAYAGIGVLWLLSLADVDAVIDAPDYGISCVWAGAGGALAAAALARWTARARIAALAAASGLLVVALPSDGLARVEHGLAFLLGGLAVSGLGRRAHGHPATRPQARQPARVGPARLPA